jgi:hypothetical protein
MSIVNRSEKQEKAKRAPEQALRSGAEIIWAQISALARAMVVGRSSCCLSILRYDATACCFSVAYCSNFFALLRFDGQI